MNTMSPVEEIKTKMEEGTKINNVLVHYKHDIQHVSLNSELSRYDLNTVYDSNLHIMEATIVYDPNKENQTYDAELTLKRLICDTLDINKKDGLYSDIITFSDYIENLWNINTTINSISIKCDFGNKIVNIYIFHAVEKDMENIVVTLIDKETDTTVERLIKRYCVKSNIKIYKEEKI